MVGEENGDYRVLFWGERHRVLFLGDENALKPERWWQHNIVSILNTLSHSFKMLKTVM